MKPSFFGNLFQSQYDALAAPHFTHHCTPLKKNRSSGPKESHFRTQIAARWPPLLYSKQPFLQCFLNAFKNFGEVIIPSPMVLAKTAAGNSCTCYLL